MAQVLKTCERFAPLRGFESHRLHGLVVAPWNLAPARGVGGRGPIGESAGEVRGIALDEQDLIRRARGGDLDAYGELVRMHQAAAWRLAALLAGEADAQDVAQNAMVKAHAALPRFREGLAFRPWLLRIVANEARNSVRGRARRRQREHRWAVTPRGPEPDTAERVLARERDAALWQALAALPDGDRAVLGCRYLLELSVQETADALGCAAGTVKSRQSRALRRLERLLDAEEVTT